MATRKDYEHAELLTRSTNLSSDLRLVKAHQWQTTYYSLLLSAGMFALLKYDPCFVTTYKHLTLIAVMVASIVQGVFIVIFQSSFVISLCEYRKRANVINVLLQDKTRLYRTIDPKSERRAGPRILNVSYTVGFFTFGLAGPIATFYYSWAGLSIGT